MDSTVRVWNLEDGQCIRVLAGHTSLVGLLSTSPNSLVSAAADATLKIWNPNTNELKHTLTAHTDAITAVAHDDDKILSTSGTSEGSLLLWNTRDGTVIRDMWPEVGGQKFGKSHSKACGVLPPRRLLKPVLSISGLSEVRSTHRTFHCEVSK